MAHSVQYWFDYMNAEKNTFTTLNGLQPAIDDTQTFLDDLDSTSKVARWRLIFWVVATCVYSFEVAVDLAIMIMESLAKKSRFGTIPWYVNEALLFQYGDTLVYVNNEYQYPTINIANQIVKRAAVEENGNTINVKVATLVGGVITPLSLGQKAAVEAYFDKKKPAGSDVVIISDPSDELRLFVKAYFDPQLLDNTGQLISNPGIYPLHDAINNFISNLNVSNFNGRLELCDLVDAMQKAIGITSAYVTSASARYGANPYVPFTERYQSNAGHLVIDNAFPLTSTVTYANV